MTTTNVKKIRIKAKPQPVANINVASGDIRALESCIEKIREYTIKNQYRYSGPVSFKTEVFRLHSRRASSGEGSGTQFYYQRKLWRKQIKVYHEQVVSYILQETASSEHIQIELELI